MVEMSLDLELDYGSEMQDEEVSMPRNQKYSDDYLATNAFRVIYQNNNFFLPQILDMINKEKTVNLRPEYQRRSRWTNAQRSSLIESLILNIPVPPVYFFENEAARYEVMDGQQRLNAIRDFFAGEFALTNLNTLTPLNGFFYDKCSEMVRRTLERATIMAIVMLRESESEKYAFDSSGQDAIKEADLRRLVFNRLNTGARYLNPQEIRNALNPGSLNKCIIELSRYKPFTETFGIPPHDGNETDESSVSSERQKNQLYSTMGDCELVLRFVALRDAKNIRGGLKSMLDRAMAIKYNDREADKLRSDFRSRIKFLYKLFDRRPFRIPAKEKSREKISVLLYDASMVALDRVWEQRDIISDDKIGVISRMTDMLQDDKKYRLIIGTKTAESIRERIDLLGQVFLPG